jgi:hypothetical protein
MYRFNALECWQIWRNMGTFYVIFRVGYELLRRSGVLRWLFPTQRVKSRKSNWENWLNQSVVFFSFAQEITATSEDLANLREKIKLICSGYTRYFHAEWLRPTDWHTHPITGYRYDPARHWTTLQDISIPAGDIKYIWERSRFNFLYDLIRFNQATGEDVGETLFAQIEDWINQNPVNCGPNWMCSQEIGIRTFSWIFALYYYRNSPALYQERFDKISESLYNHFRHIATNRWFARFAVRNNHALTEAAALYTAGLLFPYFAESGRWKTEGKRRFEEEIVFQIQENGTYIQHSMNYHRMVIQLLTWVIQLAELNGDQWNEVVYERAKKSIVFLRNCQDEATGFLPNYGNNDGTLLFPLSSCHFRDFRPQLHALARLLKVDLGYGAGVWEEEARWFNSRKTTLKRFDTGKAVVCNNGYFVFNDRSALTFIRTATYRSRPFQADNLHLDIWVDGENLLQDAGTYLYNTTPFWIGYFAGTGSHNTVQLGNFNQMKRGPRFVWYNWITKGGSALTMGGGQTDVDFVFEGFFEGFKELGKGIVHRRKVTKGREILHWTVEDWIENLRYELPMQQRWNVSDNFAKDFGIRAFLKSGAELLPQNEKGWISDSYGHKRPRNIPVFSTSQGYIRTEIFKL